jgi:hypothetical protein
MRVNEKDVPEAVPNSAGDVPKTESRFADSECHDVELRMEVVRISDVRRRGTTGDATGPDRLIEIRRRISSGVYDSVEVRESVAQRILDRRDV